MSGIDISIIIPVLDEEESLQELCDWIRRVLDEGNYTYEIIVVDDGSRDRSWKVISELTHKSDTIKGIRFNRNYGKSAALHTGFQFAEGDVVITMDADLQDSPDEIPDLYNMIMKEDYDLVSGWKKNGTIPLEKQCHRNFSILQPEKFPA